jgi:hypothetical protein
MRSFCRWENLMNVEAGAFFAGFLSLDDARRPCSDSTNEDAVVAVLG